MIKRPPLLSLNDKALQILLILNQGFLLNGCSPSISYLSTCLPGKEVFNYSGSIQTFTLPGACSSSPNVYVKMWGAGGAGGGSGGTSYPGGGGGFAAANVVLDPALSYSILVGGGGSSPIAGGYGGGGNAGTACCTTVASLMDLKLLELKTDKIRVVLLKYEDIISNKQTS